MTGCAALFSAMLRREAYATSGPRPIVRFFGGWELDEGLCERADFAARGYAQGVPMGGVLPERRSAAPRFAVFAQQDPGTSRHPGVPLQRIQIVKGWVDAAGVAQETTFEVAGDPDNGASVDLSSCQPQGSGFDSLCTVWEDPQFNPSERAFYYARVVENPTCRWHKHLCNDFGVDCGNPATIPPGFETCCDGSVPDTVQERAWTSPIWYQP